MKGRSMIKKTFGIFLVLVSATSAYAGCAEWGCLPKEDGAMEIAKAIREQTDRQSRDAYFTQQAIDRQTDEMERVSGAIESQTMLGYPRY